MRVLILALAPMLLLAAASPASAATAIAGAGTGQAAFTICFNFNLYEFSFAGTSTGGNQWSIQATLMSLNPQCFPPPQQVFTGTWDAANGGCGLASASYLLCMGALPLGAGIIPWRVCPLNSPVCDGPNTLYSGTAWVAGA